MTDRQKEILFWVGVGFVIAGVLAGLLWGLWGLLVGGTTVLPKLMDAQIKGRQQKEQIQAQADQRIQHVQRIDAKQKEVEVREHQQAIETARHQGQIAEPETLRSDVLKDMEKDVQ